MRPMGTQRKTAADREMGYDMPSPLGRHSFVRITDALVEGRVGAFMTTCCEQARVETGAAHEDSAQKLSMLPIIIGGCAGS